MGLSDFTDMRGTELTEVDLTGARFTKAYIADATFRSCELSGVVMRGTDVFDTEISGEVRNLVVNGVDVAPLVEAELDRRHPERPAFRPTTAEGFRAAWDVNGRVWAATVERAGRLPEEELHASVAGEWSFVQTLRHLAFVSQAWVARGVLGRPRPWHPLALPWDDMSPRDGVPHDREARPSLDEALALRHELMALVREVVDALTDEDLDHPRAPLVGPGWPDEGEVLTPRECLSVVLNEEWWHRIYAERDLAVLESRA